MKKNISSLSVNPSSSQPIERHMTLLFSISSANHRAPFSLKLQMNQPIHFPCVVIWHVGHYIAMVTLGCMLTAIVCSQKRDDLIIFWSTLLHELEN